jgi:hypothetical protein
MAGLVVVIAGVALRRAGRRLRATVLCVALAGTALWLGLTTTAGEVVARGAFAGALCVALAWLGQSLPARTSRRRPDPLASTTLRRPESGVVVPLLLLTALGAFAPPRVALPAPPELGAGSARPIVALLPYDGPGNASVPPPRVILRRDDAERLEALSAAAGAPVPIAPRAFEAVHTVGRQAGAVASAVVVTSRYVIDVGGRPDAAWTFPVEDATEITATLDGHPLSVEVEPGGATAVVRLVSPGAPAGSNHHELAIRRSVRLRSSGTAETLRLAINRHPTARVVVEGDAVPGQARVEVAGARGLVTPRGVSGGDGVDGILGPVGQLEVRWSAEASEVGVEVAGAVDGLLLWEAALAGDHLVGRFTCRNLAGTRQLRLGLEPGLVVRAPSTLAGSNTRLQGSAEHPEWVAGFDPPLADGATVELEFWRPAGGETSARVLPRIEPLGVERYTGAVGFRRPADWPGRLAPGDGVEPMTDEAFVRAWGSLSDEPLTFAGAVRFAHVPDVAVAAGPPPVHLLVEPEVELTIEPGRIAVDLVAHLTAVAGRCHQVELAVPASLVPVSVEGDALTDWSRPAPERLRLRFDGLSVQRRDVRLRAWLPVATDPLATAVTSTEVAIPWPRWIDVETRPGQLTIVCPTRFQLAGSSGATPLPAAAAGGANRAVYRVDRPDALGTLSWDHEPPRLGVLVLSQLTVLPDHAEWVAVLRCDVSGGGAETVHLRLPAAWAGAARVQVIGEGHDLTTETRGGSTFWRIRPTHPLWGSQRMVVRSALPLPTSGTLEFPELVPLGRWGAVDTYLALVDASGRELAPEGSPGLQPIADELRFQAEEFRSAPGIRPSVYHVRRESWSLKLHAAGEPRAGGPFASDARVLAADLSCTLEGNGGVLGLAVYTVEPRSGPFLGLVPPGRSEPIWATVNNAPVTPLVAPSGRWLVPVDDADEPSDAGSAVSPVQVRLIWRTSPPSAGGAGATTLELPALAQPGVPTFVTTCASEGIQVATRDAILEPVPRARLELIRLEWHGRRIIDSLGRLDRSSQRACEVLVGNLVQYELLARDAWRAAVHDPSGRASSVELPIRAFPLGALEDRLGLSRRSLSDALRDAALEGFAESARVHVGLVADDPETATLEVPEPPASVRLRCLGRPQFFQGRPTTAQAPLSLKLTRESSHTATGHPRHAGPVILLAALLGAAILTGTVVLAERVRRLAPLLLGLVLLLLACAAGPAIVAGGLAMAWLGWAARVT